MKMKIPTLLVLATFVTMLSAPHGFALDDLDVSYVFGEVQSINKEQIVVSGYDYETEKDISVVIKLTKDTEISGINVENPSTNVWAEVNYVLEGDTKVAVSVVAEADDETTTEE